MSTRCQIGFYDMGIFGNQDKNLKNWDVLIYRHSDGYPVNVVNELMPILQDFDKKRGLSDTEYAGAWLCAKWKTDYLNIGVSKNFHYNIEYFYAVTLQHLQVYHIQVYDVIHKNWDKPITPKNFYLIKTINIKNWSSEYGK